uniref:Uncharacterized protein n=1 Tax=Sinocyclocheilus rhinocerous TaxID=307959 RepID=A0A673IX02_9TELE
MSLSAKDKALLLELFSLSQMTLEISPRSAPVQKHGITDMSGVYEAVNKITLTVFSVFQHMLSHCILAVLGMMFLNKFTLAWLLTRFWPLSLFSSL